MPSHRTTARSPAQTRSKQLFKHASKNCTDLLENHWSWRPSVQPYSLQPAAGAADADRAITLRVERSNQLVDIVVIVASGLEFH